MATQTTVPTTRAAALATRVEAANAALIDAVRACSSEGWQKRSATEGWSVAVLAHHVAVSYEPIAGAVRTVAEGGTLPPMSLQGQAATNARHAEEFAHIGQQETIAALQRGGAAAATVVRGLHDEQFSRTTTAFGGQPMSVEQLVVGAVIGHPQQHLASIQAALAS
jgi:uncharacterized damage-inducible protein DinB